MCFHIRTALHRWAVNFTVRMYLIGNLTCHLTAIACVSSSKHPKPPPVKVINSFLNLVHSIAYKIIRI